MGDELCANCYFWESRGKESGSCQRHAPAPRSYSDENPILTAAPLDSYFVMWPITNSDDWCGEYKPKAIDNPPEGKVGS
jgi:hypothetical protein